MTEHVTDADASGKVVRCPTCRAKSSEVVFSAEVTYRATASGEVLGLNDDGALDVDWYDAGTNPDRWYRLRLTCGACCYEWASKRAWRSSYA